MTNIIDIRNALIAAANNPENHFPDGSVDWNFATADVYLDFGVEEVENVVGGTEDLEELIDELGLAA